MKWKVLPSMPKPDSHIEFAWIVVNNSIVIVGGTTDKHPQTKKMVLNGEVFQFNLDLQVFLIVYSPCVLYKSKYIFIGARWSSFSSSTWLLKWPKADTIRVHLKTLYLLTFFSLQKLMEDLTFYIYLILKFENSRGIFFGQSKSWVLAPLDLVKLKGLIRVEV